MTEKKFKINSIVLEKKLKVVLLLFNSNLKPIEKCSTKALKGGFTPRVYSHFLLTYCFSPSRSWTGREVKEKLYLGLSVCCQRSSLSQRALSTSPSAAVGILGVGCSVPANTAIMLPHMAANISC